MCFERRRAEACVDESAHHALGRLCERRMGIRRGVREGACIGGATMPQGSVEWPVVKPSGVCDVRAERMKRPSRPT
jgi:hypothetical protein